MNRKTLLLFFILSSLICSCVKNEPVSPTSPPQNLILEVKNGSINLSWDEVDEADGYKIFLSDFPGYDTAGTILDMIGTLNPSYSDREPEKAGYYHVRALKETYYGDELSEPSNEVNTMPVVSPDSFQCFIWGTVGENAGFGWDSLGNGKVYPCDETTKDSVYMFLRDFPGGFYLFSADEFPFEGNHYVTLLDMGEALFDTIRIIPTHDSGYEEKVKIFSGHLYGIYTQDKKYIKLEVLSMDSNSITFRYVFQKFRDLPVF